VPNLYEMLIPVTDGAPTPGCVGASLDVRTEADGTPSRTAAHSRARAAAGPLRGLSLRTSSAGPAIVRKGIEVTSTGIAIFEEPNQSFHHVLTGPASYTGMHLPVAEFTAITGVMLGREPKALNEYLRPSPGAMGRLQRLHASVRSLAEDAPVVLAQPESTHLIHIVFGGRCPCNRKCC
jgi:hypothetical protein